MRNEGMVVVYKSLAEAAEDFRADHAESLGDEALPADYGAIYQWPCPKCARPVRAIDGDVLEVVGQGNDGLCKLCLEDT